MFWVFARTPSSVLNTSKSACNLLTYCTMSATSKDLSENNNVLRTTERNLPTHIDVDFAKVLQKWDVHLDIDVLIWLLRQPKSTEHDCSRPTGRPTECLHAWVYGSWSLKKLMTLHLDVARSCLLLNLCLAAPLALDQHVSSHIHVHVSLGQQLVISRWQFVIVVYTDYITMLTLKCGMECHIWLQNYSIGMIICYH